MEQTLDLAQLSLEHVGGEHFLQVEAGDTLASVLDRLRDHQCVAAVYGDGASFQVLGPDVIPELICKGPEALSQPISSLAQPLLVLAHSEPVSALSKALQSHAWIGVVRDGKLCSLLDWSSWARFTAQRRLASAYRFSPEWGRTDIPNVAKVV